MDHRLLNNAVSTAEVIQHQMIWDDTSWRILRAWRWKSWLISRCYPSICLWGLRKTMWNVRIISVLYWETNQVPPEYKSEAL